MTEESASRFLVLEQCFIVQSPHGSHDPLSGLGSKEITTAVPTKQGWRQRNHRYWTVTKNGMSSWPWAGVTALGKGLEDGSVRSKSQFRDAGINSVQNDWIHNPGACFRASKPPNPEVQDDTY